MNSGKKGFLLFMVFVLILTLLPSQMLQVKVDANNDLEKFEPEDGQTILVVGQDSFEMDEYSSLGEVPDPGGYMIYTNLSELQGQEESYDEGGGLHDLQHWVTTYPNSVMQIGLYIVNDLENIDEGLRDENIDRMAEILKTTNKPIFLRIGYEFDGPWNHYDSDLYILAYQRIVDRFNAKGVNNVAYIWHSAGFVPYGGNDRQLIEWYPGDEYVDWVGVSWFPGWDDANKEAAIVRREEMAQIAIEHGKPLMIGESAPKEEFEGNLDWYKEVMQWIEEKDVKMWSYINQDWNQQSMWVGEDWGNSRVQDNEEVFALWQQVMNAENTRFINSSNQLYEQIGFVPNVKEDLEIPTAPPNLKINQSQGTEVSLEWDVSADNVAVTGYEIYANGIFRWSTKSTNHIVTNLLSDTEYTIGIRARDAAGNLSESSNEVMFKTDTVLPTLVEAESFSSSSDGISTGPSDGGTIVQFLDESVWTEYEVYVPETNVYQLKYRSTSGNEAISNPSIDLWVDGELVNNANLTFTGSWSGEGYVTDFAGEMSLEEGKHTIKLTTNTGGFNLNWFEISNLPPDTSGLIEAEDYSDIYGEEIRVSGPSDGGEVIGWIFADNWMEYELDTLTSGTYKLEYRIASGNFDIQEPLLDFLLDGNLIQSTVLPYTVDWNVYQTYDAGNIILDLEPGTHTIRLFTSTGGFNLNWFKLTKVEQGVHNVPGKIEAENYKQLNSETIINAEDDSGTVLSWISPEDSVEYEVIVPSTGMYDLTYRVASNYSDLGDDFEAFIELKSGENTLNSYSIEDTGGWNTYRTQHAGEIYLEEGTYTIHMFTSTGGFNLNWIQISEPIIYVHDVPGQIEAEEYVETSSNTIVEAEDDGGTVLAWILAGDSIEYEINVPSSGIYVLDYRVSSNFVDLGEDFQANIKLQLDGETMNNFSVIDTEGWNHYVTEEAGEIELPEGKYNISLVTDTGGFNLNWFKLSKIHDVPSQIEAEQARMINSNTIVEAQDDGGTVLAWILAGDEMEFEIDVPSSGKYALDYRVSSNFVDLGEDFQAMIDLKIDNETIHSFNVVDTGGWNTYATEEAGEIYLEKGSYKISVFTETGGFNLNWFNLSKVVNDPYVIPVKIKADDYSYMVGAESVEGTGNKTGLQIGANDWLEYNISVETSGYYKLKYRIASSSSDAQIQFQMNENILNTKAIPNTKDLTKYQNIKAGEVYLEEGTYIIRLYAASGTFNLEWFQIH
ncbi:carbohydrate-binding protein [Chengkuizengella marina]|uniref:Carbohydrate-binding protein n=1 Tax=Chengkuizengella marina TaxID=2507566 RepID=A0A6N9Q4G9_9BACL|nr:carbohydrate-binding protein [Chengkuizengella marina]NBI29670.1 carbohydrate-binding protein [Chengkuizengella marina]